MVHQSVLAEEEEVVAVEDEEVPLQLLQQLLGHGPTASQYQVLALVAAQLHANLVSRKLIAHVWSKRSSSVRKWAQ